MERVDIAIIGSGPAGVSAALTADARGKSIAFFGSKRLSDKVAKAHAIRNYPGLPDVTGAEFVEALNSHLAAHDIDILEEQVSNIYAMGDYFAIQTSKGMHEATTVIIATGAVLGKSLPGEDEFLGRGVSYCATCDAFLYKDKTVAVLGQNAEAPAEAEFLAETCQKVYYLPGRNGGEFDFKSKSIEVIQGKPQEIKGGLKVDSLETTEGAYPVDGVFILKDAISPEKLVPGLEMDGGHIKVDLQMRTNIPGCFACGDIAGKPYQYVKAAGQGNVAALSAVDYLTQQNS